MQLARYWDNLLHVIFPKLCAGCDAVLLHQEEVLCLPCIYDLPQTDFHIDQENETARQLWGKLNFGFAVSMLRMPKYSSVEDMIHKLKYQNQPHIGIFLGNMYGEILKETKLLEDVDLIIPVPIHPQKKRKRGYNQAECFATGLSQSTGIPVDTVSVIRQIASASQTKKSRTERYENVAQVFACQSVKELINKHVLIVDDVLTTGATMAAVGNTILKSGSCRVSVATIVRP